jgi:hypothetical protein
MVDWSSPSAETNSEKAAQGRNERRAAVAAAVTGLANSEREVAEVLDRAAGFNGNPPDKAALVAKIRRRLSVSLEGQTEHSDYFVIEMRDKSPGAAQAAANWVLQGTVAKVKADVAGGGGLAALPAPVPAGSDFLSSRPGMFVANPVKVVNEAQVASRGVGYGLSVLLAAVILAGFAATARRLRHQFELVVAAARATAGGAAARRAAAYDRPRVRRRISVPARPILLRPIPEYFATAGLPGTGGLANGSAEIRPARK